MVTAQSGWRGNRGMRLVRIVLSGFAESLKKLSFERLLVAVMTSFYPSMATTISSSQAEPDFIALNSSANGCISAKTCFARALKQALAHRLIPPKMGN
jgi:hypothetical protein